MKKRELRDGGGNETHERETFQSRKRDTTTRREEVIFFFIFCSSIIDVNTYGQEKETKLLGSSCETEGVMDSVYTTVVMLLSNLPLALHHLFRTELGALIS